MSDNYESANQADIPSDHAAEPQHPNFIPEDADPELLEAFMRESGELVAMTEETLLSPEKIPKDGEAVRTLVRAFHNIKGTSAFFEISIMMKLAHHAESFFRDIREPKQICESEYADPAIRCLRMFKKLFRNMRDAMDGQPFLRPEGYDELLEFLIRPEKTNPSDRFLKTRPSLTRSSRNADVKAGKTSPALPIRKKKSAEMPVNNWESLGQESGTDDYLIMKSQADSLLEAARGIRGQAHEENFSLSQNSESSVRVSVERLDRFIDMVGELVVSHSMLAEDEVVKGGHHRELMRKITHSGKIVHDLQHMSMSMRMVPLRATFQRMSRLVRDMARKLGKKIIFETEGDDTEIDRNMVEIVNDPLVHIIRNAVDHGIELPEIRRKKGKASYGTVKLSAFHSSGNVILKVRDDGLGLDRTAILSKAMERRLIRNTAEISDHEMQNLIFRPWFSTARKASEISVRGMGLDAVKKNIEALHGQMEVTSVSKKGSEFRIHLPLTLAIIDGMVVRVGAEKYVMPTMSVVRSVRPKPESLSSVAGKGEMLSFQGRFIPLFRVADIFGIRGAENDPLLAIVVIVEDKGQEAGLLVDELIGNQQIVTKTLGEFMRNISGISGSAIMPNGRVGLILDIGGLVSLAET